jgi:predicted acetyltransferase
MSYLKITLRKARNDDKTALQNMFQFYLHDLSAYTDNLTTNTDCVFENDDINTYYEKDTLIPMMIECDNTIIGFILLNMPPFTPSGYDYHINDFFILKKYRGQGLGKTAVRELLQKYSGKFAMVQLLKNTIAIHFWEKALNECGIVYEEKDIIEDGEPCRFQSFIKLNLSESKHVLINGDISHVFISNGIFDRR